MLETCPPTTAQQHNKKQAVSPTLQHTTKTANKNRSDGWSDRKKQKKQRNISDGWSDNKKHKKSEKR